MVRTMGSSTPGNKRGDESIGEVLPSAESTTESAEEPERNLSVSGLQAMVGAAVCFVAVVAVGLVLVLMPSHSPKPDPIAFPAFTTPTPTFPVASPKPAVRTKKVPKVAPVTSPTTAAASTPTTQARIVRTPVTRHNKVVSPSQVTEAQTPSTQPGGIAVPYTPPTQQPSPDTIAVPFVPTSAPKA